jgi:hypothetical protein
MAVIKGSAFVNFRVEAGSNTSTVALRVVGGDKNGNLQSETVKYGHESHGTRTREWLRWRGPAGLTTTNPQLSDNNKNLVMSPRWVLYSKTDWPTDRRSYYKTQTQFNAVSERFFVRESSGRCSSRRVSNDSSQWKRRCLWSRKEWSESWTIINCELL